MSGFLFSRHFFLFAVFSLLVPFFPAARFFLVAGHLRIRLNFRCSLNPNFRLLEFLSRWSNFWDLQDLAIRFFGPQADDQAIQKGMVARIGIPVKPLPIIRVAVAFRSVRLPGQLGNTP